MNAYVVSADHFGLLGILRKNDKVFERKILTYHTKTTLRSSKSLIIYKELCDFLDGTVYNIFQNLVKNWNEQIADVRL